MVTWAKTDAGRTEMQSRDLVKDRATRNLLLVIDGIKTEASLLTSVAGITLEHFDLLRSLGLIAERGGASSSTSSSSPSAAAAASFSSAPPAVASLPTAEPAPLDYHQFTAALTQMISKELGLRGFMLTLAVEKASTGEELQEVARRTLDQIGERKGEAAKTAARRLLYGA